MTDPQPPSTIPADQPGDSTSQKRDAPEPNAPAKRSLPAIILLVAGGLVVGLAAWARLGSSDRVQEKPLPKVASVPAFTLIERDGRAVTNNDLLGHVWVADFIFTLCTGPCPTMSLRMRSLQEGIRAYGGDVKIVSFSVDPEYDRPPVLRHYAKRYGADPNLWWFLTGDDEAAMHKLVREGFLQAVSRAGKGAPLIHSTRFVLVDRRGNIRSWYNGMLADTKPRILHDIASLLSEPDR